MHINKSIYSNIILKRCAFIQEICLIYQIRYTEVLNIPSSPDTLGTQAFLSYLALAESHPATSNTAMSTVYCLTQTWHSSCWYCETLGIYCTAGNLPLIPSQLQLSSHKPDDKSPAPGCWMDGYWKSCRRCPQSSAINQHKQTLKLQITTKKRKLLTTSNFNTKKNITKVISKKNNLPGGETWAGPCKSSVDRFGEQYEYALKWIWKWITRKNTSIEINTDKPQIRTACKTRHVNSTYWEEARNFSRSWVFIVAGTDNIHNISLLHPPSAAEADWL